MPVMKSTSMPLWVSGSWLSDWTLSSMLPSLVSSMLLGGLCSHGGAEGSLGILVLLWRDEAKARIF